MPDVLAVLHVADLFRDPRMKYPSLLDWQKVRRYLEGTWPQPVPPCLVATDANVLAVIDWLYFAREAPYVVIDTEYDPDTKVLHLIGMGYPGMAQGLQIPWLWGHRSLGPARYQLTGYLEDLIRVTPVVFQNAVADIPVLERNLGIRYTYYKAVEDTMLAHAVLWSEWPHELEFLASIYGVHPKMKHLRESDPLLYNWGDVLDTMAAWEGLRKEFEGDPSATAQPAARSVADRASETIYRTQSLPLIPVVIATNQRGIRVNKERVEPARAMYAEKLVTATHLARASCGWPINVGSSKQLKMWLYDVMGYPAQKHKKTRQVSIDEDSIAQLRAHIGPAPDVDEEREHGVTFEMIVQRVEEGADSIVEARVLYAAAQQAKSHYIDPCFAWERRGKKKRGRRLGLAERIHPDTKIHAQASGRHSITDPPLQQIPHDLRDIIVPDEGDAWIGWDWDQAELRIVAALAGDRPLLDAFAQGWDVHTLATADIFGLPYPDDPLDPHEGVVNAAWREKVRWGGKDDLRRLFAKRFEYRTIYRGDPKKAGDIPGAKQLALDGPKLVRAHQAWLAAHPAIPIFWRESDALVDKTGASRTFLGRRRVLLDDSPKKYREGTNHQMQGAVSDIYNLTILAIRERCPWPYFVYGRHDSQYHGCARERVEETLPLVREIVERAWEIRGRMVKLPATFKVRYA